MSQPYAVKVSKSPKEGKKLVAVFALKNGRTKTIHFGAEGYSDFTQHKDEARKQRYIARHQARENWATPMTAGSLSRWILWNKPSHRESVKDFKRRFKLR